MKKLKPNIYIKDIYSINYDKLKENNIKCLLFDLDNTIATLDEIKPTKNIIELFKKIKRMNFDIYIFSNAISKRVKPFSDELKVKSIPFALKPFKRNFKKIIEKYNKDQIAIIGDQIFTDILGGNKAGINTILVDPISKKDLLLTKINRILEKLFREEEYYE